MSLSFYQALGGIHGIMPRSLRPTSSAGMGGVLGAQCLEVDLAGLVLEYRVLGETRLLWMSARIWRMAACVSSVMMCPSRNNR